jgi:hypothetical protein
LALSDIKSLVEGKFALTIIPTGKPLRRQSMFNVALYDSFASMLTNSGDRHQMNIPKLKTTIFICWQLAGPSIAQMFSLAARSVLQCSNTAYFISFTPASWLAITLHLHR